MAMTSTALPSYTLRNPSQPGGLEVLVSRLAVGMLHWSERHSERRDVLLEQRVLLHHLERQCAAPDVTLTTAHIRLVRLS